MIQVKKITFILILFILTQCSQQLFAETIPQELSCAIEIAPLLITTGEDGYSIVRAEGCAVSSEVGMPMLPVKTFFVLLPEGFVVEGLEITAVQEKKMDGRYNLKPAAPPLPISLLFAPFASSRKIQTASPPEQVVQINSIQQWGGFRMACMSVFGARYDAQLGELTQIKRIEFNLKLKQTENTPVCSKCPNPQSIQKLVINPELIPFLAPALRLAPASQRYLIVTNEILAPAFQSLLDSKISKGFEGTITTASWIYNHYLGRDQQEKIRNYIKDYQPTYLLLGGDTGVVPYRGVYARVEGGALASGEVSLQPSAFLPSSFHKTLDDESFYNNNIPCDLYYACLDGNWNYDQDGIYGEIDDHVDMLPEVFVGRAPVDNATEATQFVARVIAYGSATNSYPYNEVLIGNVFDPLNDGKMIMRAIDEITPNGYDTDCYYQSEGSININTIMGKLNAGVGFVAHAGHANNYCLQMGNNYLYESDLSQLSNPSPFIFNTIGCYAGAFDANDCIGEAMVLNKNGGAAAFIGNSTYGLYDDTSPMLYSGEYQVEFFSQALREGYSHIGEALAISKITFVPQCGADTPYRWVQYCLNLLGDPEMALPMPEDIQSLYHVIQGNVQGIVATEQQLPLIITLKNFRNSDCGSLSVTLSTDDPFVIITTQTVTFGPLRPYEVINNINQPFGFMLMPNCPCEHKIRFTLTINDGIGTTTDTIYLAVSLKVSDMDTIICYPNPCISGQFVTIANIPADPETIVYIYNLSGEMVRQIRATELQAGGSMIARWDTRNENEKNVASGIYFYRLVSSSGVKAGKIGIVR